MLNRQVSHYDVKSLALVEAPIPEPSPHQIPVKLGAVSLNYRDKLALDGEFGRNHELPIGPASDGSGTVAPVGNSVQRSQVGDRVTSLFAPQWLYGKVVPRQICNARGPTTWRGRRICRPRRSRGCCHARVPERRGSLYTSDRSGHSLGRPSLSVAICCPVRSFWWRVQTAFRCAHYRLRRLLGPQRSRRPVATRS